MDNKSINKPLNLKFLILIFICILMLVGILIWRYHFLPPKSWRDLQVGEPRNSVIKKIGLSIIDQRDAKGFELWNSDITYFMFARGRWQLLVSFDEKEFVSWKNFSFQPFESKGHNEWIPAHILYRIKNASISHSP